MGFFRRLLLFLLYLIVFISCTNIFVNFHVDNVKLASIFHKLYAMTVKRQQRQERTGNTDTNTDLLLSRKKVPNTEQKWLL